MSPHKVDNSLLHGMEDCTSTSSSSNPNRASSSPYLSIRQVGPLANRRLYQRVEVLSQEQMRAALMLMVGGATLYFLLVRVGELHQATDVLRYARWTWLLPAVLCASITELAAVLSLSGALDYPLAFQPLILVQLASTLLGRITPKGIGGIGLIEHYLERIGVERPIAIIAVATTMLASSVVPIPALVITSILIGSTSTVKVHVTTKWLVFMVVVAVVSVLYIALFFHSEEVRRRLIPLLAAGRNILGLLHDPIRVTKLFGGAAGVIAMKALTLAACLRACGASVPFLTLITIYLGVTAISSASPTPGGLGPLELALVAGLSAVGVQPGVALAGVLIFRLFTFWLPMLPAMAALYYLQSRRII